MLSVRRYNLTRVKLLFLLEELKAESVQAASVCVPPGFSKDKIENNLATVLDVKNIPEDLSKSMAESPTGGIVFWGPDHWHLVMPPFPVEKESSANSCDIEPLYSLLHREYMIALVLLRLGEFGIGVYQGEKLVTSKVGTGLVHSRHRQGGSSAHRFERHREKQMDMPRSSCIHIPANWNILFTGVLTKPWRNSALNVTISMNSITGRLTGCSI
jgi:hypothetical protein